jgi:hypothetical protein
MPAQMTYFVEYPDTVKKHSLERPTRLRWRRYFRAILALWPLRANILKGFSLMSFFGKI